MRGVKKYSLSTLCFIILLSLLPFSFAITPTFINPTPANSTTTTNTSIVINVSITEHSLHNFTYYWNNSNYTLYDNTTTLLLMGFNNFSGIGENATSAVDVSVKARNGTIVGAVFNSTGRHGGAYSFMGNEWIITDRNFMNNLSTFTMTGWIYAEATGNRIAFFGQNDAVEFGFSNANTINFYTDNGGSAAWTIDNSIFPLNTWNFVTATANNATNPPLTLYINGIARATGGNAVVDTFGNSVYNFSIGGRVWDPTGNNFTGMIDEVMVFNRTLSAQEIYVLYSSNLYKYTSGQWFFSINQSHNATQILLNGSYPYQVFTQNETGQISQAQQRTVIVGQLLDVPEWSTIGMLFILVMVVGGFFLQRKNNM